jgi:hypothetical protein
MSENLEGTAAMSAQRSNGVRLIGLLTIIAGAFMIIAGGVTWGAVSTQLASENITVPDDAAFAAGTKVDNPISAFAQADIINQHALKASGGLTYAELGKKATELEQAGASQEEIDAVKAQRTTVMNGSFLRSSLFTSVVAYGVAALVIGLGVLFVLVGVALRKLVPVAVAAPAVATE